MIISVGDKENRAPVLQAIGDRTRLGILEMLAERPCTAGEIHAAFPIAAPAVSRHLRVLRETGLVEERRPSGDRRIRLYGLRPEPLRELSTWLAGLGDSWQTQLDAFEDYVALRRERSR